MSTPLFNPFLLMFFPAMMALAASMDLLTMTIPNRLSAALVVAYVALAMAIRAPMHDVLLNLSCGAVVLSVMFVFYSLRWIGGGDAKLASAIALWLGWASILDFSVAAALCGGLLTLLILGARYIRLPAMFERRAWIARLHDKATGVPYGIALAAAGMIQYPHSQIWSAAFA